MAASLAPAPSTTEEKVAAKAATAGVVDKKKLTNKMFELIFHFETEI